MRIVSFMVALFMTVNSAVASGKIDDSGSYFCEGKGGCGSGWVSSEEKTKCLKAPMS